MAGIFASQFGYSNPYNPVGLDTGTPQVGLNLGKLPDDNDDSTEDPVRQPARLNQPSQNAASASNQAYQSELSRMARQQGNTAANEDAMAQQAATNNAYQGSLAHLAHQQASVQAPAASPGFWSQVGHVASDIGNGMATGLHAAAPVMRDVMNFGSPHSTPGLLGLAQESASTPAPAGQQGIKVNSIRLNQGSPANDVETPQYALPRGLSANNSASLGYGSQRPAIEAPGYQPNPLADLINEPYSAMPRGWSANAGEPNFASMVDAGQPGANWSANMNPVQFNSVSQDASNGLPRGMSVNGGWESDIGNILGDIGDALG